MDISFVETMRGKVVDAGGVESPIEFEVKARAPSLWTLLRTGRTELSGVVRAPLVCEEAVGRGELVISPTQILYRVHFEGPDGRAYELEGQKRPRLLAPLGTMTRMEVVLRTAEGWVVGLGTMHFDLREVAGFAWSWLPFGRRAQRALDARRRMVERRQLDRPPPVTAQAPAPAPAPVAEGR
jgi:hypothetical protein